MTPSATTDKHWPVLRTIPRVVSASEMMDAAHTMILNDEIDIGMDYLVDGLKILRATLPKPDWKRFCGDQLPRHPLSALIWQDPFTLHSFAKPRGYSGDATLLDYIYGISSPANATTQIGAAIFRYATNGAACRSVRLRRQMLAEMIDEVTDTHTAPKVLSIACGHLREAEISQGTTRGKIEEFVVLDSDADSLAHVKRTFSSLNITTVHSSIKSIIARKVQFSDFHFVYAAGLYDYLNERLATRLTHLLFDSLASGGRLLVGNFAPNLRDIGYMETYMDWQLIYRTADQIEALAKGIPAFEIEHKRVFTDEYANVVYLEIRHK